ncbi:transcriptional regulator, MarR family [Sanguibacter gelidistatuariae]|uniref:Transcriptional regulator, MarR family n=1 Tax=Sanguibacter gelidistatuariae TaxID=1814289 RepID=A0A1G6HNR3_9MICO|nr:MarR family transcriptional regulator [Sanguibacter gelidistatuariae]SDB95909.1 transcriptional regulator, MarR family [Sanguibacter gelidistatuariae]
MTSVQTPVASAGLDPAVDPLALESQVCFALSAAARAMVAIYRPLLEPLRLTHPQYLVMLALWEHGDLSMSEISAMVHLDPATVTPLVRRLDTLGYVHKTRSERDARVVTISLTDVGQALRAVAEGIPAQVVARTGMSVVELTEIRVMVAKVVDAGQRAGAL